MDMVQILLSQVQKEVFREKSCGEVQVKLLNDVGEDHYGSQLLFVEATSIDSQGKVHKLDVVVKYAHILDEAMREKIPIGRAFQTEILIYDKVSVRLNQIDCFADVRIYYRLYLDFTNYNKKNLVHCLSQLLSVTSPNYPILQKQSFWKT